MRPSPTFLLVLALCIVTTLVQSKPLRGRNKNNKNKNNGNNIKSNKLGMKFDSNIRVHGNMAKNPVHGEKNAKRITDTEKILKALDKVARKIAVKQEPSVANMAPAPEKSGLDALMVGDIVMTPEDACETLLNEMDHDGMDDMADAEVLQICQDAQDARRQEAGPEVTQPGTGNGKRNGNSHRRTKRKALDFNLFPQRKWPDGVVKYTLHENMTGYLETAVLHAMASWEANTCIRFEQQPGTLEELAALPYAVALFQNASNGCFSYLGINSKVKPQPINIGLGCVYYMGIAEHEIGHLLGLWHEHSRPDRDDVVTIHWDEIREAAWSAYALHSYSNNHNIPTDTASLMFYGATSFRNPSKSGATITTDNMLLQSTLGQRQGATFNDFLAVNRNYNCEAQCSGANSVVCQNDGYPNTHDDCATCHCPDGYGDADCSDIQGASGDMCYAKTDPELTVSETGSTCLRNPSWTKNGNVYDSMIKCAWRVKAEDPTKTLVFRFTNAFEVPFSGEGPTKQCHHYIEIQDGDKSPLNRGPRFCGNSRPNPTDYDDVANGVSVSHMQNSNTWFDLKASSLVVDYDSMFTTVTGAAYDSTFRICFKVKWEY